MKVVNMVMCDSFGQDRILFLLYNPSIFLSKLYHCSLHIKLFIRPKCCSFSFICHTSSLPLEKATPPIPVSRCKFTWSGPLLTGGNKCARILWMWPRGATDRLHGACQSVLGSGYNHMTLLRDRQRGPTVRGRLTGNACKKHNALKIACDCNIYSVAWLLAGGYVKHIYILCCSDTGQFTSWNGSVFPICLSTPYTTPTQPPLPVIYFYRMWNHLLFSDENANFKNQFEKCECLNESKELVCRQKVAE